MDFFENDARRNSIFDKKLGKSLGTSFLGYNIKGINLDINTVFSQDDNVIAALIPAGQILTIQEKLNGRRPVTELERKILRLKVNETDNDILLLFKTI